MATYYLDYELGNDAGTGADWANAWKTITSGATAARIAPGDIIRIAKSPVPTSLGITGAWTDLSRTVTLASALTANIDMGEAQWTASANVTSTADGAYEKEGTYASKHVFAAGFTTGLAAYKALAAATDFSGYQQVSFWVRSSVALTAGTLSLRLCSDTAGATTVDTIAIPAIPATNYWQVVTVDTGGALGNAIQSVALYADADPGTPSVYLDNIIACKASASADSLTLSSLISKNNAAQGGTEGWFGIKSIDGTTVILDAHTNSYAGIGQGYSGTTETVTTYKRETIKTVVASATSTQVQAIQDSGTAGNNIEFQGGYNVSTSAQDGETFFDGQNGCGYGIYLTGKSYTTLNYLNVIRYYSGVFYSSTSHNNTITTLSNANNNASFGVYYSTTSHNNTITTLSNANNNASVGVYYSVVNNNTVTTLSNANNNSNYGVYYATSNNNTITTLSNANNNATYGVYYNASNNNTVTTLSNANNNSNYGVYYATSHNNTIRTLSTTGNATAGIYNNVGVNYINNALIAEATEIAGYTDFANSKIFSNKHDQTADNHKIFTDGGLILSEVTVRHTASGIAWKLSPTSANRSATYPLDLVIAKIACSANALVTVNAWMRKDHITGIVGKLVCRGGQIAGVASDVVATKSDEADVWQNLEITFTPTEAGVVEIEVWAYNGTTYNLYVDDMTITQA